MPVTRSPRPSAPSQATPWSSGNNPDVQKQDGPQLPPGQSAPTPPPVPSQHGPDGQVVVNTDALDLFAKNVDQLAPPVNSGLHVLETLPKVAAGGFPDAYAISTKVSSGGNGGSNLVDSFKGVYTYLANGLSDISGAARSLSQQYSSTDNKNGVEAGDVTKSLTKATNDFNSLLSADGGNATAPAPASTPAPAPSGTSK